MVTAVTVAVAAGGVEVAVAVGARVAEAVGAGGEIVAVTAGVGGATVAAAVDVAVSKALNPSREPSWWSAASCPHPWPAPSPHAR